MELIGRHEPELRGIRDAREAAERGAEREGGKLGRRGVDAHVARGEFVFANRHPGAAEAAILEIARDEDREHDEHEEHVVVRRRAEAEVVAEDRRLIERRDAVGAVGVLGEVEERLRHDLAEAEGDDREVVAAQPQGRGAE